MRKKLLILALITLISIIGASEFAFAQVRVKDVCFLAGANSNRILGYGLVVGLEGTGDSPKSLFTNQALVNMLERFGLSVEEEKVRSKNIAGVMVTGEIAPFSRNGAKYDVLVSSLGDAKSLQGGVLLQTTMYDLGGEFWGVASGPVSIGGFNIEAGSVSVRQNYAAVGRVPGGGVLERNVEVDLSQKTHLTYMLRTGDFTAARRLAEAINENFESEIAYAKDAVAVEIFIPEEFKLPSKLVEFIAEIENLTFMPDIAARVVINERTGTIVIGERVNISTVAVSHGALSITIRSTPMVSQPAPFSPRGETVVEPMREVTVEQMGTGVVVIPGTATVGDVATALNRLGVTPRDIIAIFQSLNRSGALQAELIIL